MGDLREHELPKRYRICCLSCCKHAIKPIGAEKMHACEEMDDDGENDCASLKKTVGKKDLKCECMVFKLPKKELESKKGKWRRVPKESRTQNDDDEYHFDCFCVVDTEAED